MIEGIEFLSIVLWLGRKVCIICFFLKLIFYKNREFDIELELSKGKDVRSEDKFV